MTLHAARSSRIPFILLYLLGIAHWLCFFYLVYPLQGGERALLTGHVAPNQLFRSREFTAHGWFEQNNLVRIVQEALRTGTMPYHVPEMDRQTSQNHQNRFMAFPSWPMTPQSVLLTALDPVTFTVVNLLLLYSIGFYGSWLLARRYQLGPMAFMLLFLLMNFNGYFVEKISAAGPNLLAPLLLPFFVLLILRAAEPDTEVPERQVRGGLRLGLLLAAILYQGDVHIFIELVTFVLLWGLVNARRWRFTLVALIAACAMGTARLLPAALTFGPGPDPHVHVWMGYPYPETLVEGLVLTRTQLSPPIFSWWEYSAYISIVGLFALVYFGLWEPLLRADWVRFRGWRALALPCLALVVMSFRRFKDYLIPNWIPLLNAEAMTTRYIIIPLAFLVVIAAINLQGFLERQADHPRVKWLLGGGLVSLGVLLFNHSRIWRMHRIQSEFDFVHAQGLYGLKPEPIWNLVLHISNRPDDRLYISSVWVGLIVSAIAWALVAWLLARRHRVVGEAHQAGLVTA